MRVIGLTGGIACGKSNISAGLRALGAEIIDGDELSRRLTCPGGAALPFIREAFGNQVFTGEGTLKRGALAALIFSDGSARAVLDSLMGPLLMRLIDEALKLARQERRSQVVMEMPLLYEKGLDRLCDVVWCAWLPGTIQLSRLMLRDGLTEPEALGRIAAQLPVDEKARRADVVIDTSGTMEETRALVPLLYRQEMRLASLLHQEETES